MLGEEEINHNFETKITGNPLRDAVSFNSLSQ